MVILSSFLVGTLLYGVFLYHFISICHCAHNIQNDQYLVKEQLFLITVSQSQKGFHDPAIYVTEKSPLLEPNLCVGLSLCTMEFLILKGVW